VGEDGAQIIVVGIIIIFSSVEGEKKRGKDDGVFVTMLINFF
jgi:hypothetical protein